MTARKHGRRCGLACRYSAPQVPFPFTSREAFEGARRHPLGSDFNTLASHKCALIQVVACSGLAAPRLTG